MLKSPFPGMNPFLEGSIWPDVHHDLATRIKEQLAPQVVPQYFVRIETYTVEDTNMEEGVNILYPDVEILKRRQPAHRPFTHTSNSMVATLTPVTLSLPTPKVEVRIPVIEIRDTEKNQLITAIEVLSPVNKRKPGLKPYRKKRRLLQTDGVHLLEIDLLRRGERPFQHPQIPDKTHYMVSLVRGGSHYVDIWSMSIKNKLPVVPVPLKTPDEDIRLDLGKALADVYEKSYYGYSINYEGEIPPPTFSKEDQTFIDKVLESQNG